MEDKVLITKLIEFRRLPDETECVEFKEAKTKFDIDKLGQYFSALSNEANLKDKEFGWNQNDVQRAKTQTFSNARI
jgi:ATP-dependent DNA helicase RecG